MAQNGPGTTANHGEDVGQPANGIFSKLQLVFPSFPSPKRTQTLPPTPTQLESADSFRKRPKFIKVRIITWNMHDSLPKGDLQDLLGSVPAFIERKIENDDERFHLPNLSLEEGHPYHIIVVGGQECPTLSGIPMGLAANFKHKSEPNIQNHQEPYEAKNKRKGGERHTAAGAEPSLPHPKHEHRQTMHPANGAVVTQVTSSWTDILEDWFSNGVGSLTDVKPVITMDPVGGPTSPTSETFTPTASGLSQSNYQPNAINFNWQATESRGVQDRIDRVPTRKGPYRLLAKDRLMGIYTAIFVHRDIYPLIKGVSTDTVPAGLIGGRLGNKGGVGVSLNLNGTRLLFINAHLAAHDGNAALRTANICKIKTELNVESFLSSEDPRLLKEDLTEKFDYTWIFGDLNFRLNITRLHADWLIARKEFNKAFAFDELHELFQRRDPAFEGFKEAKIDFPPTFKYNLPHRKHIFHHHKAPDIEAVREEYHPDVAGSQSSMSSEESFLDVRRQFNHRSAHTLLSHIALTSKHILTLCKRIGPKDKKPWTNSKAPGAVTATVTKSPVEVKPHGIMHNVEKRLKFFPRAKHHNLTARKSDGYDSSSKQRVPSWCDRILWKATVKQEEHKLPAQTGVRGPRFGKARRPSRMSTSDSYALERDIQNATPKATFKSLDSSPENRSTSFDLRTRPSKERNITDPGLTPSRIRHQSVSLDEEYRKELDRQSASTYNPPSAPSSPTWKTSPMRWLPQFLTRESSSSSRSNSLKSNRDAGPRRGELVCLSYHTLNDEQMSKLEGWSDHRPVIGSYAIHL